MTNRLQQFSLLGGPLHRLAEKLGLVRNHENTIPLGLALGLLTWGVWIVLSLIDGAISQTFSLSVIGVHVRLLLAIPLFFACEYFVAPRMSVFITTTVKSGVVAPSSLPKLNAEINRVNQWKNAWLPECFFLLIAAMLPLIDSYLQLYGTTASAAAGQEIELTMANQWYWVVCLTLFRFRQSVVFILAKTSLLLGGDQRLQCGLLDIPQLVIRLNKVVAGIHIAVVFHDQRVTASWLYYPGIVLSHPTAECDVKRRDKNLTYITLYPFIKDADEKIPKLHCRDRALGN
jgi:hypothetical protein